MGHSTNLRVSSTGIATTPNRSGLQGPRIATITGKTATRLLSLWMPAKEDRYLRVGGWFCREAADRTPTSLNVQWC